MSIDRFENVATPLTAATVVVPESVPPPGLVPMAIVTFAVDVVRPPDASSIRTVTAGETDAPAVAVVGCWRYVSLDGAGVTLKVLLVFEVRPVLVKVSLRYLRR